MCNKIPEIGYEPAKSGYIVTFSPWDSLGMILSVLTGPSFLYWK
jgi:hypothetical protein